MIHTPSCLQAAVAAVRQQADMGSSCHPQRQVAVLRDLDLLAAQDRLCFELGVYFLPRGEVAAVDRQQTVRSQLEGDLDRRSLGQGAGERQHGLTELLARVETDF